MKLIIAIVNNDDAHFVNSNLSKAGFFVTKISSTGGFLMSGNSTFLMGVPDKETERAIDIIQKYSKKRVQSVPIDMNYNGTGCSPIPGQVTVGGATVFVMNIEQFRHI